MAASQSSLYSYEQPPMPKTDVLIIFSLSTDRLKSFVNHEDYHRDFDSFLYMTRYTTSHAWPSHAVLSIWLPALHVQLTLGAWTGSPGIDLGLGSIGFRTRRLILVLSSLTAESPAAAAAVCAFGSLLHGADTSGKPIKWNDELSQKERAVLRATQAVTKIPASRQEETRTSIVQSYGEKGLQQIAHLCGVAAMNDTIKELLCIDIPAPIEVYALKVLKDSGWTVGPHRISNDPELGNNPNRNSSLMSLEEIALLQQQLRTPSSETPAKCATNLIQQRPSQLFQASLVARSGGNLKSVEELATLQVVMNSVRRSGNQLSVERFERLAVPATTAQRIIASRNSVIPVTNSLPRNLAKSPVTATITYTFGNRHSESVKRDSHLTANLSMPRNQSSKSREQLPVMNARRHSNVSHRRQSSAAQFEMMQRIESSGHVSDHFSPSLRISVGSSVLSNTRTSTLDQSIYLSSITHESAMERDMTAENVIRSKFLFLKHSAKISKLHAALFKGFPSTKKTLHSWIHSKFGFLPRYLLQMTSFEAKRAICSSLETLLFTGAGCGSEHPYLMTCRDKICLGFIYFAAVSNNYLASHFAKLSFDCKIAPADLKLAFRRAQSYDMDHNEVPADFTILVQIIASRIATRNRDHYLLSPELFQASRRNPWAVLEAVSLLSLFAMLQRYTAMVDEGLGAEPEVAKVIQSEFGRELGLDKMTRLSVNCDPSSAQASIEIKRKTAWGGTLEF
ncbi:hypothetical protein BC830DRAFT_1112069 [Chytriomyces sp. MP71]|nr:hypothetical protein BC830DRAFT_1112069 [Chytriomyces sp. MP71]